MSAGWCFFSADLQVSATKADADLRSDLTDGARVLAHRHHASPLAKIITRDNISIDIAAVMQRSMAKEAEAERERREKIAAEVVIGGNPASHPPNIKKNINGGA